MPILVQGYDGRSGTKTTSRHDWLRLAQASITLKRVVNGKRCVPYMPAGM